MISIPVWLFVLFIVLSVPMALALIVAVGLFVAYLIFVKGEEDEDYYYGE